MYATWSSAGSELRLLQLPRHDAARRRAGGRRPVRRRRGDGPARGRRGRSPERRVRGRQGAEPGRPARARRAASSTIRLARQLAAEPHLALLCGRYEGVDERIRDHLATDAVSVGPYVLSGGELAAMVVIDAVIQEASRRPGARRERGRGVLLRGARRGARVSALHPPRRPTGAGTCPRSSSRATTPGCGSGGWSRAASGPPALGRAESRSLICPGRAARGLAFSRPEPRTAQSGAADAQASAPDREPMSTIIESIEQRQLKRVPRFSPGDRVRVHFQVVEGNRKRTQVFEGVVIARRGAAARETFTVRKQSFGVGVERTFPVHSPEDRAARGDRAGARCDARSSTTCGAGWASAPGSPSGAGGSRTTW